MFLPVGPASKPNIVWLIKEMVDLRDNCELSDKLFKLHKKIIIKEAKKVLGIDPRKPAKLKKWLEVLAKDGAEKLREICQKATELYEQKFIEGIARRLNLQTRDKWEVLKALITSDKVRIRTFAATDPTFLKRFNLDEWPYVITDPTLPSIITALGHPIYAELILKKDEEGIIKFWRNDDIRKRTRTTC